MTVTPDAQAAAALFEAFAEAFNAKDAQALGALFTEDAEFVTIFGNRMRGRAGIETGHAAVFTHALSGNRLVPGSVDVQLLAPGVSLAHAAWTREQLTDAPAGTLPPGTGIFTLVLQERDRGWLLRAATNVQHAVPPTRP
jgi:uncharacterized protein (TIGR02246 family)